MKTRHTLALVCLFSALVAGMLHAEDWLRFRGPNGAGVSTSSAIPLSWSDEENIKWKLALPGPGSSCPIVLGDRVFVTCYSGYGVSKEEPGEVDQLTRHLLCIDRINGNEIWRADVASESDEDPYQGFITEHGYASSTPVTDGEHIFVLFGKTGVVAFDMQGNKKWRTSVGEKSDPAHWGGGASTVLHDDLVIVNAANVGNAIVALNTSDGSEVWKYEDPELTNCWSTPIEVDVNGREEMVICIPGKILALDPHTGEELWFAASPVENTTCASVIQHEGNVFAMGGRRGDAIGVRCGGSGDVSDTHTVWQAELSAGIGTPVVVNGKMFWTSRGMALCADCENGDYIFKKRIKQPAVAEGESREGRRSRPKGDYASAIAVGDQVILVRRSGTTHILAADSKYKLIATNELASDPGPFNATPAVSDGELFLRSDNALYCISAD